MSIKIYYDGNCPFCRSYTQYLRLKESQGEPQLIDVRIDEASRLMLRSEGFDLDRGMVVDVKGRLYSGEKAVAVLAGLSSKSNLFNRINGWLFSSVYLAAIFYPVLRLGRNLVLLVLGVRPVNENPENQNLILFSCCWGFFSVLHVLVYSYQYGVDLFWSTYLVAAAGFLLFVRPDKVLLLLALLLLGVFDAWLQMPSFSNHTIIKNFFLLAIIFSGLTCAWRGDSWSDWFEVVAPVGRALLLMMYVFGVFHKLNSGFLDPSVSCAVELWRSMPWPLYLVDWGWARYLFIYGTLIAEVAILVFLLVPRFRHCGVLLGIAFHMMLALSNYAMYTAFSMLSVVLHILFISRASAKAIIEDPLSRRFLSLSRSWRGWIIAAAYLSVIRVLAWMNVFWAVTLVWFFWVVPFLWIVFKYGKDKRDHRVSAVFFSKKPLLNVISLLFFVNCITPYLGLKTAQSINMFANLRLEDGVSNHLVLSSPPGPFLYLENVVRIVSSTGVDYFNYVKANQLYITYYDFLNRLEQHPAAIVSYEREGHIYLDKTAEDLSVEMEKVLHPEWVRKWFHFIPVDLNTPKACALDR